MSRPLQALLLLLPVPSLGVLAGMFWWPESGVGQVLFGLSKLWIVALPAIWYRFVERKPWSRSPAEHGGFGPAVASGVAVSLLIFGAYFLVRPFGWIDSGMIRERAELTGLANPVVFIGAAIYWITVNSLVEEYVWRWFVFRQFEKLIGGKAAVVASAFGFTLHHIFALWAQFDWRVTALASLGVFVGGLLWSWLYLRYRSVWPCWVSHAIVDVPIFVIGWWLIF
ncbi:CPBP family intramembrane glutamic endopeptidase [Haloferula sp. A504]|uniref:CPBP family intramembrane glutamic endopeptidase n=1 Tax=Haloferula sp. A504 TaxID=3373601 RepID=UPI0031C554BB|nr:CPBP family intramembrane metalloprotease [Verrucomicrobiaceae bacterium E54]